MRMVTVSLFTMGDVHSHEDDESGRCIPDKTPCDPGYVIAPNYLECQKKDIVCKGFPNASMQTIVILFGAMLVHGVIFVLLNQKLDCSNGISVLSFFSLLIYPY
jgi:hypothetical protein